MIFVGFGVFGILINLFHREVEWFWNPIQGTVFGSLVLLQRSIGHTFVVGVDFPDFLHRHGDHRRDDDAAADHQRDYRSDADCGHFEAA